MKSREGRRGEGEAKDRGKRRQQQQKSGKDKEKEREEGGERGREQKRSGRRGEEERCRDSTYMFLCLVEYVQRRVAEFGLHSLLNPVIHVDAAGCSRRDVLIIEFLHCHLQLCNVCTWRREGRREREGREKGPY